MSRTKVSRKRRRRRRHAHAHNTRNTFFTFTSTRVVYTNRRKRKHTRRNCVYTRDTLCIERARACVRDVLRRRRRQTNGRVSRLVYKQYRVPPRAFGRAGNAFSVSVTPCEPSVMTAPRCAVSFCFVRFCRDLLPSCRATFDERFARDASRTFFRSGRTTTTTGNLVDGFDRVRADNHLVLFIENASRTCARKRFP